jgi:hypothetical protein
MEDTMPLELMYQNKSIGTIRDPDPRQIQCILEGFTGMRTLQPCIPVWTNDDGTMPVLQWDPSMKNFRQVARLRQLEGAD